MKIKHRQNKKIPLARAILGRKPVWRISTGLFNRKNTLFTTVSLPCLLGQYAFSDYVIPHQYWGDSDDRQNSAFSVTSILNRYHFVTHSSLVTTLKQIPLKHGKIAGNDTRQVSNKKYGDYSRPETASQQCHQEDSQRVERIDKRFFSQFINNQSTFNPVLRADDNRFMCAINNQWLKRIASNMFKQKVSINLKSIQEQQGVNQARATGFDVEPQVDVQGNQKITRPLAQHYQFAERRFITDKTIESLMTKETLVQQEIQSQLLQINQSLQDKEHSQRKMISDIQQSLAAISSAMEKQPSAQPATFRPASFYGRFK